MRDPPPSMQSSIMKWLKSGPSTITNSTKNDTKTPSSSESTDTFKVIDSSNTTEDAAPQRLLTRPPSSSGSLKPLPANVIISHCTEDHIKSYRRLNALLLPIPYPDYFYKETLEDQVIASVTRTALWRPSANLRIGNNIVDNLPASPSGDDKIVAAIRCRMLECPPHKPASSEPVLYISTIGTLAPFRELSLASHLLEEVIEVASRQYGVSGVYAHVWEANERAMEWYCKRGFTVLRREDGYYRRLAPKTAAWLIKRDVTAS